MRISHGMVGKVFAPPVALHLSSSSLAQVQRVLKVLEHLLSGNRLHSTAATALNEPARALPHDGRRDGDPQTAIALHKPRLDVPLLHFAWASCRCPAAALADDHAYHDCGCPDRTSKTSAPEPAFGHCSRLPCQAAPLAFTINNTPGGSLSAAAVAAAAEGATSAVAAAPDAVFIKMLGPFAAPAWQAGVVQQLPVPASCARPWRLLVDPMPQARRAPLAWQSLRLPAPQCAPMGGSAARNLSLGGPSISLELKTCRVVHQVKAVVKSHESCMRPVHLAEAVQCLGFLTFGSRDGERPRARRLAAEYTAAALGPPAGGGDGSGGGPGVGLDVLIVLVRGWGWLRKPPPKLLAQMLEALVPGSSSGLPPEDGQPEPHVPAPTVRQGYGRLHTATLRDVAALVEPLAALGVVTAPMLQVLVNLAVRRAGNEPPAAVAAAALAYVRGGVTDPQAAQAFLTSLTARRHGGSADGTVTAGHIAEALALCNKARWYDPRVFSEAADALVARGVGELSLRQTWAVLRAFTGAGHEHPLLTNALATHAKAFDFRVLRSASARTGKGTGAGAGASTYSLAEEAFSPTAEGALESVGRDDEEGESGAAQEESDGYPRAAGADNPSATAPVPVRGQAARQRDLKLALVTLDDLVHGFSSAQVYDTGLYDSLAAGAAALLRKATAPRLAKSQPRALAAVLTSLLEGFAAVGVHPGELLAAMTQAQQQQPGWLRSMSVDQVLSLTCSLAELRYRDETLLERLDLAAATFLENTVLNAAAAAGLLAAHTDDKAAVPVRVALAAASGSAGPRNDVQAGPAVTSTPSLSWLPTFLDAACRRLWYPCPRTAAMLAAPVAVVVEPGSGGQAEAVFLRALTKEERKSPVLEPGVAFLSRLQLLLLVALQVQRDGGDGGMEDPAWFCELMGGLACSGARLSDEEERDLAWALARSLQHAVGHPPEGGAGADAPTPKVAYRNSLEALGLGPAAKAAAAAGMGPGATETGVAGPAGHDAMAAAAAAAAHSRPQQQRRSLTAATVAAALDDAAACHLFRAVVASQYRQYDDAREVATKAEEEGRGDGDAEVHGGGREPPTDGGGDDHDADNDDDNGSEGSAMGTLEAALHHTLTPPVAAALLARAARAWHAAGLGTAMPRPAAPRQRGSGAAAAAAAMAAAQLPPLRRLRHGVDASQSPLLSELLRSLGLPVFEQWETSDGFFLVARGVVLPGGQHVGVEVLPDNAFATSSTTSSTTSSNNSSSSSSNSNSNGIGIGGSSSSTSSSSTGGSTGSGGAGSWPVLVGDSAFRARCLAARGWRLVALPAGEWAAAEVAGPAACMLLMRRHSAAL